MRLIVGKVTLRDMQFYHIRRMMIDDSTTKNTRLTDSNKFFSASRDFLGGLPAFFHGLFAAKPQFLRQRQLSKIFAAADQLSRQLRGLTTASLPPLAHFSGMLPTANCIFVMLHLLPCSMYCHLISFYTAAS